MYFGRKLKQQAAVGKLQVSATGTRTNRKFVLVLGIAALVNISFLLGTSKYYSLVMVIGPSSDNSDTNSHQMQSNLTSLNSAAVSMTTEYLKPTINCRDVREKLNRHNRTQSSNTDGSSSSKANNPAPSYQKIIVIFPFRNRHTHLKLVLSPIHQHLISQVVHLYIIFF